MGKIWYSHIEMRKWKLMELIGTGRQSWDSCSVSTTPEVLP